MKSKPICILIVLAYLTSCNQSGDKCCNSSASVSSMASFAKDKSFKHAHEAPEPFEYTGKGKMISFPTPDGKNSIAYFIPSKNKSNNYIFIFHEWWGLNNYIKQMADLFSDSINNSNVIALDLYDGKVATTSEEAGDLMQSNNSSRSTSIIKGAINYAGKNAGIATVGWCFGGGWSMQGALLSDKNEKGCVMYYGMPEKDVTKLKNLNSDVLFIWGSKDQWINTDVKNTFVKNMSEAGKTLIVKEYNADHAFANPSNPHHDKAATADAQRIAIAYLRNALMK